MKTRSLYICYFGLREPLVQTQVLPYLRELVASGSEVSLLTFEPERRRNWTKAEEREWREKLRRDGIEWHASTYHKRPSLPATLFDIAAGALRVARLARKKRLNILHARSHVPAAMGALAKKLTRAKLLFDVRGLLADEYVDSGNWKADGFLYRMTKRVEKSLYNAADGYVVLTERARRELFPSPDGKPVAVIPCCFDPARFDAAERDAMRAKLHAADRTVIIYVGSLGGLYLAREMAELLAVAKSIDPRVFPLILSQSRPELITTHLAELGFEPRDYHVGFAAASELPSYLVAGDVALSIVKPAYSKLASSPTKFAEYLASGLPVISTRGIGDLDEQIGRERIGVLLDGLDAASYRAAYEQMEALRRDPTLRQRCIDTARRMYDLHSVGGVRYARLYQELAAEGR